MKAVQRSEWERNLREARALESASRYADAIAVLENLLSGANARRAAEPDALLATTLGMLGDARFQVGRAEDAVEPFEQALAICERIGDEEGRLAYLGNLLEASRYLGRSDAAAQYAEALAEEHVKAGLRVEAERLQRRAELIRRTEPLNRVVVEDQGSWLEVDDVVSRPAAHLRFRFERNRPSLRSVATLVERGKHHAARGYFEAAIVCFRQAAELDHHDPDPPYHAGLALLLRREYEGAAFAYQTTEALAPGWFHCRSTGWLAAELAVRRLNHDVVVALLRLEDEPMDARRRLALTRLVIDGEPRLPHLWFVLGRTRAELGQRAQARRAFLRALELDPEPDVRTRVLVELAGLCEAEERERRLREAAELKGNLVAAAMATILLRNAG